MISLIFLKKKKKKQNFNHFDSNTFPIKKKKVDPEMTKNTIAYLKSLKLSKTLRK